MIKETKFYGNSKRRISFGWEIAAGFGFGVCRIPNLPGNLWMQGKLDPRVPDLS